MRNMSSSVLSEFTFTEDFHILVIYNRKYVYFETKRITRDLF